MEANSTHSWIPPNPHPLKPKAITHNDDYLWILPDPNYQHSWIPPNPHIETNPLKRKAIKKSKLQPAIKKSKLQPTLYANQPMSHDKRKDIQTKQRQNKRIKRLVPSSSDDNSADDTNNNHNNNNNSVVKKKRSVSLMNPIQRKAYENRTTNPNAYYYRFNSPGEKERKGTWSASEHKQFMKRVLEKGVNIEWGIFSKKIKGRVGYQCSCYWRKLQDKNWVKDENYIIDNKGNRRQLKKHEIENDFKRFRKYQFTILVVWYNYFI